MRTIGVCLGILVAAIILASPAIGQQYDVVIRGGKVVDGTGNPWFLGDVAIREGKIAVIGRIPEGRATLEIDAKGLIVAPGFIDMHSHSDTVLLEDGRAESKIRQGVTTEVLGEGSSAGPRMGKVSPQSMRVKGETVTWRTLGEYFAVVEKAGISINIASYVGLDNAWQSVMGTSYERPTAEQFAEMQRVIDQAMEDGSIGLSSMLAMPPGSLATTDDIVLLCEPVAKHGGLFSTHNRNEGTGVFDAIREAIAVGLS
jgi:N-acyl-D-amino-acid deacylase